jgi:CubicO group peptidase (beta-lactamase class C family)
MLTQATGRSLADYGWAKLWNPLGMEYPTYWIADSKDREMAYGGLNMAARDYAKLGDLYRRGGDWNGNQIISADWVKASVTPDAPHLMAEKNGLGYGYQWWIPDGDMGEFCAIGVYNQFIYVNPEYDVVIVKLSATPTYGTTATEESNREMETIEFLRAIAKAA